METEPRRKKLRRIENPLHTRYLTFSCYHRLQLFSNDAIKDAFLTQLEKARIETGMRLYAWVIMPEHVHLLVRPGKENPCTITRFLKLLKGPFSSLVLERWRQLDAPILPRITDAEGKAHFWQAGGGYDRNIWSEDELLEKRTYIHLNPFRRKLVPEDNLHGWRWSSGFWIAHKTGMRPDMPADPM